MKRQRTSWANELPRYYLMKGGRVIRRPHEEFKPIDLSSPPARFDYASWELYMLGEKRHGS